jgi:hypothetical protein
MQEWPVFEHVQAGGAEVMMPCRRDQRLGVKGRFQRMFNTRIDGHISVTSGRQLLFVGWFPRESVITNGLQHHIGAFYWQGVEGIIVRVVACDPAQSHRGVFMALRFSIGLPFWSSVPPGK